LVNSIISITLEENFHVFQLRSSLKPKNDAYIVVVYACHACYSALEITICISWARLPFHLRAGKQK
jgi:hypothetical protein